MKLLLPLFVLVNFFVNILSSDTAHLLSLHEVEYLLSTSVLKDTDQLLFLARTFFPKHSLSAQEITTLLSTQHDIQKQGENICSLSRSLDSVFDIARSESKVYASLMAAVPSHDYQTAYSIVQARQKYIKAMVDDEVFYTTVSDILKQIGDIEKQLAEYSTPIEIDEVVFDNATQKRTIKNSGWWYKDFLTEK